MAGSVSQSYGGNYCAIYKCNKSSCCTTQSYVILYVNYISKLENKVNLISKYLL